MHNKISKFWHDIGARNIDIYESYLLVKFFFSAGFLSFSDSKIAFLIRLFACVRVPIYDFVSVSPRWLMTSTLMIHKNHFLISLILQLKHLSAVLLKHFLVLSFLFRFFQKMTHLLYIISELSEWQTSHRKHDSSKLLIAIFQKDKNCIFIPDYEFSVFRLTGILQDTWRVSNNFYSDI